MDLNEYQERAAGTMGECESPSDWVELAKVGMIAEAGEALDCYKKLRWRGAASEKEKLILELGDLMFYLAAMFTSLRIHLRDTQEFHASALVCSGPGADVRKRLVNLVRLALMFESDSRTFTLGWAMIAEVHAIALCFGHTLDDVLQGNLDKLARRFKGRFTPEEAAAKADMMSDRERKLLEQLGAVTVELGKLQDETRKLMDAAGEVSHALVELSGDNQSKVIEELGWAMLFTGKLLPETK